MVSPEILLPQDVPTSEQKIPSVQVESSTPRNQPIPTASVSRNRQSLARMLHLRGYMVCKEALVIIEDYYTINSHKYESIEEFINKLNRVITFDTDSHTPIINQDLAFTIVQELKKKTNQQVIDLDNLRPEDLLPADVTIRVKNVQYSDNYTNRQSVRDKGRHREDDHNDEDNQSSSKFNASEFIIHYDFLFKKLNSLPIFHQEEFQLTKLSTLTASSQPNIRCICFGLLVKDLSKIDGYLLIDGTGRVPVNITPDTNYRNRLAYLNCIVLVEGVYVNPDDILYAANIGLPPVLLDPLDDKATSAKEEQMVVVLKELYLDDEDVCNMLDLLFAGYNCMENPPALFVLIGDFSREPCQLKEYQILMKKFIRILRLCDKLKDCHFILVPGQHDTSPMVEKGPVVTSHDDIPVAKTNQQHHNMPKPPLTKEQIPINLLQIAGFKNVHLATNPAHIYINDRLISVVSHSYIKELRKYLLYDMSDHREELFDTVRQIITSNAHLAAGIDKNYHTSMNLWQRPDLLILADCEAFGNRYDCSMSSQSDTSFMTVPSFSRQSFQFKVYYLKTGEIEESQVSSDVLEDQEPEVVDLEPDQEVSELDQ